MAWTLLVSCLLVEDNRGCERRGGGTERAAGRFSRSPRDSNPAPGGGSAAALVVAIAARLVGSVAQISAPSWNEAGGVQAQAEAIERRISPLVDLDARRYEEALHALGGRGSTPGEERDALLGEALARAAEPPLQIAEAAADIAELATLAAEHGEPAIRADVVAAATLAEAAAAAAATLVEVNLGTLMAGPRIEAGAPASQARRRGAPAR